MKILVGVLLLWVCCIAQAGTSFQQTKKEARIIWSEHRETLYCHCPYDKQGNVQYHHCAYQPQDMRRAARIEWEHVVPVSWFGRHRPCWQKPICVSKRGKRFKGRDCCDKIDPEFSKMYHDLHNLVPVIGEINKARGCLTFGDLSDQKPAPAAYGNCGLVINEKEKKVTPNDQDKGLIARVVLYMTTQYDIPISSTDYQLYLRWNQAYPPSEWERQWNTRVHAVQQTDNPFISHYPAVTFHSTH